MNTNSFLTTCFLLCLLLAGATTSLSAQLRVLRPEAGVLGSRVNVSGDSPHTPTANFSLLSNTHRIGMMIDHESRPLLGNLSSDEARIGLKIQYPQAEERFVGMQIALKQLSTELFWGQHVSLLNEAGGPTRGVEVSLNSYFNAPESAEAAKDRNGIGFKSTVRETVGVEATVLDAGYLAAFDGLLSHKYRPEGYGTRLELANYGTNPKQFTYGLSVKLWGEGSSSNSQVRGVYSEVAGKSNYAAHFKGNVLVNGQLFNSSDQSLKHSVVEIAGATELLEQLKPRRYGLIEERDENYDRKHYGFVAQEIVEALPDLVQEFVQPAVLDTAGNVIVAEQELLAVRYQDVIALLTATALEQQATIENLMEQVAELSDQVAIGQGALLELIECTRCPITLDDKSFRASRPGDGGKSVQAASPDTYRLFPNPANNFFTIEAPDKQEAFTVYLYAPDGKLVLTTSSLRPRINVDTQGLAAGTYVVKLVDEHGKVENRQVVVVR